MKFYGPIGYATNTETAPGVWSESIVEKTYYGEVLRNVRAWQSGDNLGDELRISNRISIVADEFSYSNISFIRYVKWQETFWEITNIEIERPRLILTLGGVYNASTG